MYSSKGVESRCVQYKVWELRIEDWGANLGHSLNCFITYVVFIFLVFELTLSVCVFGDDHVTCYMGANMDAGEHVDA